MPGARLPGAGTGAGRAGDGPGTGLATATRCERIIARAAIRIDRPLPHAAHRPTVAPASTLTTRMRRLLSHLAWLLVGVAGAGALGWLALRRGETVSAGWLLTAAVCSYLVAFRFYSKFIAARVFALDAARATP